MTESVKDYYSIGEASKICNISRKALRFYDQIGIITPDFIGDNNYRYYSRQSLLSLTIVKYYKQMGFKLEEMRKLINSTEYGIMERGFGQKITELEKEAHDVHVKLTSVCDWKDLLVEAQTVIENDVRDVSVKFMEPVEFGYMDQPYIADSMEAIINIDWTDYLEKIQNEIAGPVIISYPSYRDRVENKCETMRIMQKMIMPAKPEYTVRFGGRMVMSCYHIGSHATLKETYDKMEAYAEEHGYVLAESSTERYVTDYWTTVNEDIFVTEIMIGVSKRKK